MIARIHAKKEKEREIREAMAKFIALQSDKTVKEGGEKGQEVVLSQGARVDIPPVEVS